MSAMTSPASRTLRRAAETLGGESQLARLFGVPRERVHGWISGSSVPPPEVYFAALDVVAGGALTAKAPRRTQ